MPTWGPVEVDDGAKRLVRIVSVNLETMTAFGASLVEGTVDIFLNHQPSGMVVIPRLNEEWVIERHWDRWVLAYRSDWQNPLFANLQAGDTKVGGKRLTLAGDVVTVNSAASYEASATLAAGVTGFVKYQASPTGEVFCWGEVGFAAVSGTVVFKEVATVSNLAEGVKIRPTSRRSFPGMMQTTAGWIGTVVQVGTDGKVSFSTPSSGSATGLYLSTSWFVRQ